MAETVRCTNCGTENIVDKDNKLCKECGKDLSKYVQNDEEYSKKIEKQIKKEQNSKNKNKSSIFSALAELISFLISACVISLLFALPIFVSILRMSYATSNDNALQQIFDFIQGTSSIIGVGIGLVAGLIITAFSRNDTKLKQIENNLEELQNQLQEKGFINEQ